MCVSRMARNGWRAFREGKKAEAKKGGRKERKEQLEGAAASPAGRGAVVGDGANGDRSPPFR